MRTVWVERCSRWREVRVSIEWVARELRAWPRNPKVAALVLGDVGYLDVASANVKYPNQSPASAGERGQTVHFPHHAHVHRQDPETIIFDNAAVP